MACICSTSLHWFDSSCCCRPFYLLHLTNHETMKILSLKMDVRCKNPGDLIIFVKYFRLRKKKKGNLDSIEQSVGLRIASSAWAWLPAARAVCWQQTCRRRAEGGVAARQVTVETSNQREQQVQRTNNCCLGSFGWFRRRQKEKKNFQRSQWKKVSGFSDRGTAMPSDFISFSSVDLDLNFRRSLCAEGEFSSVWP